MRRGSGNGRCVGGGRRTCTQPRPPRSSLTQRITQGQRTDGDRVPPMMYVKLFGSPTVVTDHGSVSVTDLGGVKPRQILEILALSAGSPVPKDRLAELLWDGQPPKSYVATLEGYVCVLRRRLGQGRGRRAA